MWQGRYPAGTTSLNSASLGFGYKHTPLQPKDAGPRDRPSDHLGLKLGSQCSILIVLFQIPVLVWLLVLDIPEPSRLLDLQVPALFCVGARIPVLFWLSMLEIPVLFLVGAEIPVLF